MIRITGRELPAVYLPPVGLICKKPENSGPSDNAVKAPKPVAKLVAVTQKKIESEPVFAGNINKNPGQFGVEFMTPDQARRHLERQARFTKRTNLKAKAPLGVLAPDDGMTAVGALYCSGKGSHHEMCTKAHQTAIKRVGPSDEFWKTDQPYFKGRERKWRTMKASPAKNLSGVADSKIWEDWLSLFEEIQHLHSKERE